MLEIWNADHSCFEIAPNLIMLHFIILLCSCRSTPSESDEKTEDAKVFAPPDESESAEQTEFLKSDQSSEINAKLENSKIAGHEDDSAHSTYEVLPESEDNSKHVERGAQDDAKLDFLSQKAEISHSHQEEHEKDSAAQISPETEENNVDGLENITEDQTVQDDSAVTTKHTETLSELPVQENELDVPDDSWNTNLSFLGPDFNTEIQNTATENVESEENIEKQSSLPESEPVTKEPSLDVTHNMPDLLVAQLSEESKAFIKAQESLDKKSSSDKETTSKRRSANTVHGPKGKETANSRASWGPYNRTDHFSNIFPTEFMPSNDSTVQDFSTVLDSDPYETSIRDEVESENFAFKGNYSSWRNPGNIESKAVGMSKLPLRDLHENYSQSINNSSRSGTSVAASVQSSVDHGKTKYDPSPKNTGRAWLKTDSESSPEKDVSKQWKGQDLRKSEQPLFFVVDEPTPGGDLKLKTNKPRKVRQKFMPRPRSAQHKEQDRLSKALKVTSYLWSQHQR